MPIIFRGGSAALRQVIPIHKRGPDSFFLSNKYSRLREYILSFDIRTIVETNQE